MAFKPLIDDHKSPMGIYIPLPDDDPIYAAVGRVASAWAIFEHHLDETIAKLAEIPKKRCACITAQMQGPAPRLSAIIALSRSRSGSKALISKIEKLLQNTYPLADRRNRVVHDPVFIDIRSKKSSRLVVTAKKVLQYSYEPIQLDEINTTRDDICEHTERFLTIQSQIYH